MQIGQRWGTICGPVSEAAAQIICRSLGLRGGAPIYRSTKPAPWLPILMSGLKCSGTEPTMSACSFSTSAKGCKHARDAAVRCKRERGRGAGRGTEERPGSDGGTCPRATPALLQEGAGMHSGMPQAEGCGLWEGQGAGVDSQPADGIAPAGSSPRRGRPPMPCHGMHPMLHPPAFPCSSCCGRVSEPVQPRGHRGLCVCSGNTDTDIMHPALRCSCGEP